MHVYFSHSYRDVAINSYFLRHFIREDIPLFADQKSAIWCVAKLERYMFETRGFISVIPRRVTEKEAVAYSQYIGHELNLARRARIRRLLFVDEQVLERYELDFPEDAVSFNPIEPDRDSERHIAAITAFRKSINTSSNTLRNVRCRNQATVVVDDGAAIRNLAEDVCELLRRERFEVRQVLTSRRSRALDDIRLLETLWRSELCVFILGERLSDTHITLAMAHSHCIPSVRLQFDKRATDCAPSLTGLIHWQSASDALIEFKRQLTSFRRGFVEPIEIAKGSNVVEAARSVGTTQWEPTKQDLWDSQDGPALLNHVYPGDPLVQDQVNRIKRELRKSLGTDRSRPFSMQVCRSLYDGLKHHKFVYEVEPQIGLDPGIQKIRPPSLIEQSQAATCIDLACLFASLLEAANQNPLILVLGGGGFSHALVGYRALDEPAMHSNSNLGDIRGALQRGDVVLFETTGVVEAEAPVGVEHQAQRQDKLLDFMDAKEAATRFIGQTEAHLLHVLDVVGLRQQKTA